MEGQEHKRDRGKRRVSSESELVEAYPTQSPPPTKSTTWEPVFPQSSTPKRQRHSKNPKRPRIILHVKTPSEREEAEIVVLMRISSILSGSGRVVYKGAWTKLQRFSVGRHEILGEPIDFPEDRQCYIDEVLTGLINYLIDHDNDIDDLDKLIAAIRDGTANHQTLDFPMPRYSRIRYDATAGLETLRDMIEQYAGKSQLIPQKVYEEAEMMLKHLQNRTRELRNDLIGIWPGGVPFFQGHGEEQNLIPIEHERQEAEGHTMTDHQHQRQSEASAENADFSICP
ncbi:MAG: hypothetical protein M1830_002467 [Pleopsidium flavum]|nr:MAG: hypothetical protein M1830_002467 [Pleopsidium flavum]